MALLIYKLVKEIVLEKNLVEINTLIPEQQRLGAEHSQLTESPLIQKMTFY